MNFYNPDSNDWFLTELKFDILPLNTNNSCLRSLDFLCYKCTQEIALKKDNFIFCSKMHNLLRCYRDYSCKLIEEMNSCDS